MGLFDWVREALDSGDYDNLTDYCNQNCCDYTDCFVEDDDDCGNSSISYYGESDY